jgi:hypothetical protein
MLAVPTVYFPLLILTLLVLLGAHPLETASAVGVSAPALARSTPRSSTGLELR